MPKSTFYNLPETKRKRILEAGKYEFSNTSLKLASVNRIIKRAKISKGSFYQYFINKEEFYWYIIKKQIKRNISMYDELLIKYDGDIFKVEETQFEEMLKLLKDYRTNGLVRNLFLYSYHDIKQKVFDQDEVNFTLMYQIYIEHKKEEYKVDTLEEFTAFFDMLRTLANAAVTGVIMNAYSDEFAKDLYDKQISYIKNGLIKK